MSTEKHQDNKKNENRPNDGSTTSTKTGTQNEKTSPDVKSPMNQPVKADRA